MSKAYTWTVPFTLEVDFDAMYQNAISCLFTDEPLTFSQTIRQEIESQDNDIFYNVTPELIDRLTTDFRNYLIENDLMLEGMNKEND